MITKLQRTSCGNAKNLRQQFICQFQGLDNVAPLMRRLLYPIDLRFYALPLHLYGHPP